MSPSTPIRLVALDLDGTLLDSQSQISPRTRQAIADAAGRGVIVLPCTGRPLASLPPLVAQLPGIRYAITSNGAAVWDMGTDPLSAVYSRYSDATQRSTHEPVLLERHCLPPETAREVFALYREYHGPLSIFSDGRSYLDGAGMALFQDRHIQRHSTEARQPDDGRTHVVRDLDEWMSRHAHEVEKFCMFFDSIEIAQAALVRFRAFPGIEAVQGAPDNVEVRRRGGQGYRPAGSGRLARHPPGGHPCHRRQRQRPRHAGPGRCGRRNGQRSARDPGTGGYRQHPRQRPRRRCRAV